VTPDLKAAIRALAVYAIGPREDWRWMLPSLVASLSSTVNDFRRNHMDGQRATPGFDSPEEYWRWWLPKVEAMNQAWPAQVQPVESHSEVDAVGREDEQGRLFHVRKI